MVVGLLFWLWIGGLLIIVGGLGIARFVCCGYGLLFVHVVY